MRSKSFTSFFDFTSLCRPGRFGLFTAPAPLAISDTMFEQKKRKYKSKKTVTYECF